MKTGDYVFRASYCPDNGLIVDDSRIYRITSVEEERGQYDEIRFMCGNMRLSTLCAVPADYRQFLIDLISNTIANWLPEELESLIEEDNGFDEIRHKLVKNTLLNTLDLSGAKDTLP